MRLTTVFFILFSSFLFSSCHSSAKPRVINPSEAYRGIEWSDEDLALPIAVRTVWLLEYSSAHVVRLNKSEVPHVHDAHDLIVTVLRGKGRVHIKDKTYTIRPGDVIEIPRGFTHWVEKTEPGVLEAYLVSTPPYSPTDYREVPVQKSANSK